MKHMKTLMEQNDGTYNIAKTAVTVHEVKLLS